MDNIEIVFEDIESFEIYTSELKENIKKLVEKEKKELGEITVIFSSDKYLLEMNRQYLNHDYFTDIITFDYVEENRISGDLFISIDRIKENACNFETFLINELYRVVFHGVLHLVGYKDKTDGEQKLMREKENYYLGEVDFEGKIR